MLTRSRFGFVAFATLVACSSEQSTNGNTGGESGGGSGGTTAAAGTANGGTSTGGTTVVGGSGGTAAVGGQGGSGGLIVVAGNGGGGAGGTAGGAGGAAGGGAGGTGGTGGTPAVDPCVRTNWVPTGSPANVPGNAIDADNGSRWTSGADQDGDEYFQIRFPSMVTLDGITLVANADNDFPVMYKVQYSTDGTTFDDVIADDGGSLAGAGTNNLVIAFPEPLTLLTVRVLQTGSGEYWWSINNLTAQGCLKYTAPDGGAPDASDGG